MLKLNKEVVNGSFVLLVAFNLFSLFNFLYQFAMARLLTISEYGVLAALFSIVNIMAIFSDSIQTIITKYSSKENNIGKINNLFKRTFGASVKVAVGLFSIFLIGAIILARVWEMSYFLIAFTGIIIFSSLLTPISRGIMQGKKRFKALGLNLIFESGLKMVLAIALVLMGFKVFGAIAAVVISGIAGLLIAMLQIRDITKTKEKNAYLPAVYQQSTLIFIYMFAISLFYNVDIIIGKAIFSPEVAGYYAIASILGKIIFWGTQPISRAMLPIASERRKGGKNKSKNVFYSALIILSVLVFLGLVLFYFFPELIIKIYSGKEIVESSKILFKVGIAMALIAYSNLILFYKIAKIHENKESLGKEIKPLLLKGILFGALIGIEIVLLYASGGDINKFSQNLLLSAIIFLIGSFMVFKAKR